MAYISEYWKDKKDRAELAIKHTKRMETQYASDIAKCVKKTETYSHHVPKTNRNKNTQILVVDMDTVKAGYTYNEGIVALLNFASYKEPGGLFLNGSKAQEECLCHASYLYNVLRKFETFYSWNNQHKNKALYLNRALYSPNILFQYGDSTFNCDVITCAAPNKSAAQEYCKVSDEENKKALESRIKFILDIAAFHNVDTLILGAYGCGVFGQDPTETAMIFKNCLNTSHKNRFSKVVFAVPDGNNDNLRAFKQVFK